MPRAVRAVSLFLLTLTAGTGHATDWRYLIGIHDFVVDDVDSHTYGIAAGLSGDKRTGTGRHFFGDLDVFWDHDQDHLDPDHIPIWWQLHMGSDGELWKFSPGFHVDWTADFNTRTNTVSSVERQIEVLPALAARFDSDALHASIKAGFGYWFLEIDDDAPKERGYVRDDLRNTTFAESLAADGSFKVGTSLKLVGRAKAWWDNDEWLETQYVGEARLAVDRGMGRSEIVLDAEVHEYNLEIYNKPGLSPIVPWDDDVLIRVSFVTAW